MPTIERNISVWADYDWKQQGEEWSAAWGSSALQWRWSLLPRIEAFVPAGTILEIAPGFGRWTQYLKDKCDHLIAVDLSENCIQSCKQKFSEHSHVAFHVNDGKSLAVVPDGSVDFVFSFDSLVHAEADVLETYMAQLAKKLKPDGAGFIHHSNLGVYRRYYSVQRRLGLPTRAKRMLFKYGILDNDGLRAISMTAELFERYARQAGLQCISQEIVNWNGRRLIDCLSIFTPMGSKWTRPYKALKNPDFMGEARYVRKLSELYMSSDVPKEHQRERSR